MFPLALAGGKSLIAGVRRHQSLLQTHRIVTVANGVIIKSQSRLTDVLHHILPSLVRFNFDSSVWQEILFVFCL